MSFSSHQKKYIEPLEPRNRNLWLFILITFSLSWALWLPSLLASNGLFQDTPFFRALFIFGSYSPSLTGFILTWVFDGLDGVKLLWKRCWHYYNKLYLVISITLIPAFCLLSYFLVYITTGVEYQGFDLELELKMGTSTFFTFFFFAGALQEEIGWRGYALNHLQSMYDAIQSSVILGGIWSLWHYPLFYISGTPYANENFFSFMFSIIVLSVLFTWLYNNTNGSILVAMIFHSTVNISYLKFLFVTTNLGRIFFSFFLNMTVVLILLFYGTKNLVRGKPNVIFPILAS
jgi:membrane protease YdiL (CAAX protease family)